MNDHDIQERIAKLEEKIDKIYISVEKTRRYFLWTLIITVVVMVLPLIGLIFVIPTFLASFNTLVGF